MSCTFWLRRHKAAAKKRAEEARLKAETENQTEEEIVAENQTEEEIVAENQTEEVFNEESVVEVKKPRKKAVKTDDNA